MSVTAVVPTLGTSPLLPRCVEALRAQEVPVRVVLVRQGRRALDDPALDGLADREIRLAENVGFAAATNRGIADSAGQYVATVNDDVVVADGWAAALAETLDAHPEAAAAQGVNLADPSGTEPAAADPGVDGWGIGWNRAVQAIQLGRGEPPPDPDRPPLEVFGVSATAALYRREALLAVARPATTAPGGGAEVPAAPEIFDSRLESYYEDVDLARRLRAAGWTALSVPRARALHAGSLTGRHLGSRRWRLIYGNRYAVAAGLLGGAFRGRIPGMVARDLADLARALVALDGTKIVGIKTGWCRALRLVPSFTHGGAPVAVDLGGPGAGEVEDGP